MKKIMYLFLVLFAGSANATLLTFNEGLAAPGTQLEGTSFYDSFGVSFESTALFGPDGRLPDDGMGITNYPTTTGAVNFFSAVTSIDMTWAIAGTGVDFYATAFDASNAIVDSFFFDGGLSSDTYGTASLTGAGITRLEFHDSGALVAIDTLSFTTVPVPEPSTLALLGLGLVGFVFARKNKTA